MSINLPHWLAEVINVLGFNWPEIDEDQLREAARHLRTYAEDSERSHDRTHGIVHGDLQQVYAAQSYTALAQAWGEQSSTHMKELIEVCRLLADGLDLAAVGVEGMKGEVIVQLGVAAGEIAADAGAAFFTAGLAAAAEPLLIEAQNKLLSAILQRFESEVIGALVNHTIGPIKERIDQAVEKLLFQEIASATVGGPPPGLKLDTAAIRTHGSTIKNEADANIQGGRSFSNKVSALTFTTG